MRCHLVLLGPPATGKSTLAQNLSSKLNTSKVISFDQEFPLNEIIENELGKNSKDYRREFFERIKSIESNYEWIIIDDTCHYLSMQKRYLKLESVDIEGCEVKVIFLYISARNDQIPELKRRNYGRSSDVKSEEIERITKHLNSSHQIKNNLIEFNFEFIPEIDSIIEIVKEAVNNYKRSPSQMELTVSNDIISDSNYLNQLNLAVNGEIFKAFQDDNFKQNGKEISLQKKRFLSTIRRQNKDYSVPIDELVLEFRTKYLKIHP